MFFPEFKILKQLFGQTKILFHTLENHFQCRKFSLNYWDYKLSPIVIFRSSHPEVFLGKGVLKICSKSTGEHPYRSVIWIKLQSNFIEITLQHGSSPINLLHIFRTPFSRDTSGWLLLDIHNFEYWIYASNFEYWLYAFFNTVVLQ